MIFWALEQREQWRAQWRAAVIAEYHAENFKIGYAIGRAEGYKVGYAKARRHYGDWLAKVSREKGIPMAELLLPP